MPSPMKPGWYWDPVELDFNLALRERWRRQLLVTDQENAYRLRRWDGVSWTDETLRQRALRGTTAFPYFAGPSTRLYPVTPAQSKRGWWIWGIAMVLSLVALAVATVVR
jgi:hypothetical protein